MKIGLPRKKSCISFVHKQNIQKVGWKYTHLLLFMLLVKLSLSHPGALSNATKWGGLFCLGLLEVELEPYLGEGLVVYLGEALADLEEEELFSVPESLFLGIWKVVSNLLPLMSLLTSSILSLSFWYLSFDPEEAEEEEEEDWGDLECLIIWDMLGEDLLALELEDEEEECLDEEWEEELEGLLLLLLEDLWW